MQMDVDNGAFGGVMGSVAKVHVYSKNVWLHEHTETREVKRLDENYIYPCGFSVT